jgi:hypothetical protein
VTSDRGHSNMLLIHESNNVIGHFLRTLLNLSTQLVEKNLHRSRRRDDGQSRPDFCSLVARHF